MKNNIKKIVLAGFITVIGMFAFTFGVQAATVASFSPVSVSTTEGKTFDVIVTVNPNGTSNYAEKIEVDYPTDTLKVKSFAFGKNWINLSQDGYDSIDNTKGILIKTAGYPGGISTSTEFGTITFVAKKSGNGNIKIGDTGISYESKKEGSVTGESLSLIHI